jgi:N-acetylglucosamine-6-phosphate deacetylase
LKGENRVRDLFLKDGMVLIDGKFQKMNVVVEDGKISALKKDAINNKNLAELNASGKRVVPGFLDIHTHGGAGVDVNAATAEDIAKISRFFASQGTTGWLASILTDTEEQTLWCIKQITKVMEMEPDGAQVLGIHLEGPFLCSAYKGAMPEHLLQKASVRLFQKYQQAAGGKIKYITVSPEVEGVPELIREIHKSGVIISIGHSGADYETAMKCIHNGAKSATHTFNAMKLLHQHSPAILGAVLESDVYCEAICDGRHLHPGIVRLLLKTKGMDKVIAVTDSIMATGLPDGKYKLGVNDVEVIDGDARLVHGDSRAGSTLTTGCALKNLVKFTGKSVEELIPLFTRNPATLLHIEDCKGSIAVGKDADLVILDDDLNVTATIVRGKLVYKASDDKL